MVETNIATNQVKTLPIRYPAQLVGKDIFNMSKCWELGNNDEMVFGFSIFNDIFASNKQDELKTISTNLKYQMKLQEGMSKFSSDLNGFLNYEQSTDIIWNILYDKYREVYYILIRKRATSEDKIDHSPKYAVYPNCMILIMDKEFNKLGEQHFPENKYLFNSIFITTKGLYISEDHVDNPTYNEDVMKFRLFKLKKNEI
jgi:hypothetical protein